MDIVTLVPLIVAVLAGLVPLVTDLFTTVQATGKVKDTLTFLLSVVIGAVVLWRYQGQTIGEWNWDAVWYLGKWFIVYSFLIFGAAHIAWRTVWKPSGVSENLNANYGTKL